MSRTIRRANGHGRPSHRSFARKRYLQAINVILATKLRNVTLPHEHCDTTRTHAHGALMETEPNATSLDGREPTSRFTDGELNGARSARVAPAIALYISPLPLNFVDIK